MNAVQTALRLLACLVVLPAFTAALADAPIPRGPVLVEAESFTDPGGWKLDTQFIQAMGSPYLLAHGLGLPVPDATTTVTLPSAGTYHVWVRTLDWVARWKAPGTPGRFQLLVNGKPLATTFGTEGGDWHWQSGGAVDVTDPHVKLALHDLTGFEGRCDAIIFTEDPGWRPPNDSTPLAPWRRDMLHIPAKIEQAGEFDVVVVGGGYAGTCSAISAARMGCRVALIQDRPVLGGNGSSEVRVWSMGHVNTGLYPHLGDIVKEIADAAKASPGSYQEFGDAKKIAVAKAEKNLSLYLNHYMMAAHTTGHRIDSVTAIDTRTSQPIRFTARLFVDCTGHGTLGYLAGADLTEKMTGHMGMSNMWTWEQTKTPHPFAQTPWALQLTLKDFPFPRRGHAEWFWESGFDKDPIKDLEAVRDWNFRANYGAWNAIKNGPDAAKYADARLTWMAYTGGTRESRQLLGDVVLNRDDIVTKRPFPDGCVPTTWNIDLHYPKPQYAKKYPDNPFISLAKMDASVDRKFGYPVPYRCLYSRNVDNLFMSGRCASVTHEALGTIRVMKTGGMMGEVVGKAASLCLKYNCDPRGVYKSHLDELKHLMKLPGSARRDRYTDAVTPPSR